MANPFCAVDECVRRGEVELMFPGEHGDNPVRYPHKTLLCVYHIGKLQDLLSQAGLESPPVEIRSKPVYPAGFSGDQRRYEKFKPRDDADYDKGYGD